MKKRPLFLPSIVGVLVLASGYLLIYQFWYSQTALGMSPALDGKQNLLTAEKLIHGDSFHYPFHGAPLYPFLLAFLQKINVFNFSLLSLARILNGFGLLLTTWLAGNLAWSIWRRSFAIWITGLLVGLNPVIHFFAADPLAITLATTCFTGAAWILYRGYKSRKSTWEYWLLGGLVLGVGMALQSHLMLLALCWPLLGALAVLKKRHTRGLTSVLMAIAFGFIGPGLAFLGVGFMNQSASGEFRMVPWGGSFFVWAGNGPLSNGRYFDRSTPLDFEDPEAMASFDTLSHYQRLTGEKPPFDVTEVRSYFFDESLKEIVRNPGNWIGLMIYKCFSVFHNYEQYDNKTYALHKSLSPYLSINPINWGILFTLATLGGGVLFFSRKPTFFGLIILLLLYSAMIVATYTANRYRVPLIPLLAILAGGIPKLYYRRDQFSSRGMIIIAFSGALVGWMTLIPWAGVAEKDTYLKDYELMATVAYQSGLNEEAIHYSELALFIDPTRNDFREIAALSRFEQWFSNPAETFSEEEARMELKKIERLNRPSPALSFAHGVYLWKLGDYSSACSLWEYGAKQFEHPDSLSALVWNCNPDFQFLNSLASSDWKRVMAIKNGDTNYRDSAGEVKLTSEEILAFSRRNRTLFEPFKSESANR